MPEYEHDNQVTNMTYDSGQAKSGSGRHGARIAQLTDGRTKVLLVEQTRFSESKRRYVIDHREDKSKIERHVNWDDAQALADAVRLACEGKL